MNERRSRTENISPEKVSKDFKNAQRAAERFATNYSDENPREDGDEVEKIDLSADLQDDDERDIAEILKSSRH